MVTKISKVLTFKFTFNDHCFDQTVQILQGSWHLSDVSYFNKPDVSVIEKIYGWMTIGADLTAGATVVFIAIRRTYSHNATFFDPTNGSQFTMMKVI